MTKSFKRQIWRL